MIVACLVGTLALSAQTTRTQTIALKQGWNAVFVEVYPADSEPTKVFAGTPVDIAASYYGRSSSAQFITEPGIDLFKTSGWGVWYAEDRPDAFLRSLDAIQGQQAYLIHSKGDFTWRVEGSVVPMEIDWQPDSFNFVGFGVHSSAAPTFAQFFTGSDAHRHNRIYRLIEGHWRRVTDPSGETMRSGEAFWIFCEGPSKYAGPLRRETSIRQGLVLGTGETSLVLRNETSHPVACTVEHVVSGPNPVPLSIVIAAIGGTILDLQSGAAVKPATGWTQALPPLEAGAALRVPLEARAQEMNSHIHASLLKISTDVGTEVWIPVMSVRPDLQSEP
jgi:hypothetical protein